MYCTGDPVAKTVSGEAFCKLGKDMANYTYTSMWSENTKDLNGTYDVDDSVAAIVRTDGPVITVHGAWAQNIGEKETYIDFIGTKAGIRLQYGGGFTKYGAENGMLTKTEYDFKNTNMFQNEIDAFLRCVRGGEKLPSHIDVNIKTSRIMQAIYDSSESHREIVF